jgi:hypothetical protein
MDALIEQSLPRLKRVAAKTHLKTQPSDFSYWNTQPYSARLEALEQIRRECHQWRDDAEPGLQTAYSVAIKT